MTEIERELNKVKIERETLLTEVNNTHNNFAKLLLDGEGEKIKSEINKPIKINNKQKFVFKIKKFFEKIINTIS